jgi:Fe-S-cluster-containing dehydrogenase component/CRP-like cAMP-binding protein
MPREVTDRDRVIQAAKNLTSTAELFEEQNGKQKYGNDLEVILQGRDYGNGKLVGPYLKLLEFDPGEVIMRQGEWGGNNFYIAVEGTLDVSVSEGNDSKRIGELGPGMLFGEMALLAGIERNATVAVPAQSKALVLEISRPALRLLRKLPKFGLILDETYRGHGFSRLLEELGAAKTTPLTPSVVDELRKSARYMVYGKHHTLCQEGEPIDRLILIRSGWVRRSRGIPFHVASPEIVMGMGDTIGVDFLGAGNCLGLEGIGRKENWKYSASLMSRSEVLEIPLSAFEQGHQIQSELAPLLSSFSTADDALPATLEAVKDLRALTSAEKEIATGVVDGTNLLIMDMDLCVRCGNCSLACHKVHGQSRLLRRGIQIARPVSLHKSRLQHALVPQVCLHCKDPECLTGCPTGSIFRDPLGQVDIDPHTCIGCFDCATQCPYDAISMVPRRAAITKTSFISRITGSLSVTTEPASPLPDSDDVVAIKCNLCENTPLNPAGARRHAYSCEENCPTGALVRVDPIEYFNEVGSTHGLVFRDQRQAFGRNIHKSDPLTNIWHAVGIAVTAAAVAVAVIGIRRFGFNDLIGVGWLTMRWVTGLTGLLGTAIVMTYPLRKQVYRRKAGALRYWLLVHVYSGVLAGLTLLLHSGPRTGGALTTVLYIAFEVVIFSGIWGVVSYVAAPRIMTRIEGEPLLLEDLQSRKAELLNERAGILKSSQGWLREEIEQRVYGQFGKSSYFWRQLIRCEELKVLLAEAREQFKDRTTRVSTTEERELLLSAVENIVTLQRVKALLALHKALSVWIPAHVISTALMLALMIVHIVQVTFFSVR